MEQICRLCSSSSFVQHEIFGPEGELHDRMGPFLFTPLQVRRGDGLPQRVCDACCGRVLQLHQFCSQAQCVQRRLRGLLEGVSGLVKRESSSEPYCDRATQTEKVLQPEGALQSDAVLQSECATQTEFEVIVKLEPVPGPPCWLSDSLGQLDTCTGEDTLSEPHHTTFVEIKEKKIQDRRPKSKEMSTQTIRKRKSKVKREPLQMLQTDPNDRGTDSDDRSYEHDLNSNKQAYQGPNTEDFVELEDFIQVQIEMSDSDEHTPLIDLKREKKKKAKKTPKKPASSSRNKAKPKKRKSRKETTVKVNKVKTSDALSDSDGLEDLEQFYKRQCKAPKSLVVQTEDPYACWCCVCSQTMPSRAACLQHYEGHLSAGPGPPPLLPLPAADGRCPRCGKATPAADWPAHWARHQLRPHCCQLCRLSFAHFHKFIAHGVKYHAKESEAQDIKHEPKYMCDLCTAKYTTMKGLMRHRATHGCPSPPRPRCARCAYGASSAGCLVQHVRRKHAPRRHLCAHCGKTFASTDKLKHHLVLHSGEKPYKCQYCGRGFAAAGTRRDHERTHTGEKPHVCPQCARGFAQRSALVAHVRALHAGARPHACALCGKAFAAKSLLNAHLKKPCARAGASPPRPPAPSSCDTQSPYPPDLPKSEEYCWS